MIFHSPSRCRGFTFIELVIVLLLIGLSVGLVMPIAGRGFDSLRSRAAARRLISFLNSSRIRAINRSTSVIVTYDSSARTFFSKASDSEEEESYRLPGAIEVDEMELPVINEEGRPALWFYPLGDSSGGAFYLLGADERQYTIKVGLLFALPVLSMER